MSRKPGRDELIGEVIERFVRLLAGGGIGRGELARQFRAACERLPGSSRGSAKSPKGFLNDVSHVLTLWFSDPQYLDARGHPRPLRLQGRAQCLQGLIRHVNPSIDAAEVIECLARTGSIERRGSFYVPLRRFLSLRDTAAVHHAGLTSLARHLRTLENNARPREEVRGWFERIAENGRFPVRMLKDLEEKVTLRAMDLLSLMDTDMHRAELSRAPGEPTVCVGVGIYHYEIPTANSSTRKRGSSGRAARRTKSKK